VLISVAMMFGGLREWVDAGWVEINPANADKGNSTAKWKTRKRPVLGVLGIMILTHIMGGALFYAVTNSSFHAKLVRNPCWYLFACLSDCNLPVVAYLRQVRIFIIVVIGPAGCHSRKALFSERGLDISDIKRIEPLSRIHRHLDHNCTQFLPCRHSCSRSGTLIVLGITF
jgi:hypothetical protein